MTAPTPRPVLVGVDGSVRATQAALWAASEAAARRAPLHLVTVVGGNGPGIGEAHRILDDTVRRVTECVPAVGAPHTEAGDGDPAATLAAASRTAALLVVGHRDLTRAQSLWSGSVAASLATRAGCPLVVVPAEPPPAPEVGARRIVVGVDGTADGDPALAFAFAQARRHRVPLVAVHAAREPWTVPVPDLLGVVELGRRQVDEELDAWCGRYPDVVLDRVFGSEPVTELLRASRGAQMLVVGSRGHAGVLGLVSGSVSQSVLHHADCPLVVVHAGADPVAP